MKTMGVDIIAMIDLKSFIIQIGSAILWIGVEPYCRVTFRIAPPPPEKKQHEAEK